MSHPSAPRHVSPSQWLRANCLPSARGHCVRARSYPPAPINPRLRPIHLRPQSRTCEESMPSPTCPRLESEPISTSPRPTHMRSHLRMREESAPGPTRPRLESAPVLTTLCPVPPARARSHHSTPGPTRPRPLARVRAQSDRVFTSRRAWATARATSARPQSFPAGAPCSRVHF
jgi:hypothetical protein